MRVVEYDDVDPAAVLGLNLVSLGYPLTPERVAAIRRLDPRPFPFFALYAEIDGIVVGQVGVFRLPLVTAAGDDEVGGLWAVCSHPQFRRQGIASLLTDEAHARMRKAGLRYSTLDTSRRLAAYALYRKHDYVDAHIPGWTLARSKDIGRSGFLRVSKAAATEVHLADSLFDRLSKSELGFARRHPNFFAAMAAAGDIGPDELWLIWQQERLVGYALAKQADSVLLVDNMLLDKDVEAADAIATLTHEANSSFVRVRVDRASMAAGLRTAGYPPSREQWGVFMVKSLVSGVPSEEARQLLGTGSERFLISHLDVT